MELIKLHKDLANNCLMRKTEKNGTVILFMYVDDVCCIGEKHAILNLIEETKKSTISNELEN